MGEREIGEGELRAERRGLPGGAGAQYKL